MKTQLSINWLDGMAFESNVNGHKITIDAGEQSGGNNRGPRPKSMMLLALAGCTGMDVISMLTKMRIEIEDFKVTTDANITDDHPKHINEITVIYEFWGKDLPLKKIEKAIHLSETKYCGVSHTYKQAIKMNSKIIIH